MTSTLLSEVGRGEVTAGTTIPDVPLTPKEVGARIVRAREEKPWSQFDLALALGVSPSTIYRWEKGRLPSMNELIRLTDVLEKPADYLTEPPERQVVLSDLQLRLEALEARVGTLPTRDELQRGLDTLRVAIHALANPNSDSGRSAEQSR